MITRYCLNLLVVPFKGTKVLVKQFLPTLGWHARRKMRQIGECRHVSMRRAHTHPRVALQLRTLSNSAVQSHPLRNFP